MFKLMFLKKIIFICILCDLDTYVMQHATLLNAVFKSVK